MSDDWTYEELTKRLHASNKKTIAQQNAIRKKREERKAIRKGGGGVELARKLMAPATDFEFGHNKEESIDERIAREQADRCMGRVVCPICKKFHGYCAEITEEKNKMLPTGDTNNGSGTRQRSGGLNFINNPDLSTSPQEAKILMVKFTEKGKQGPSITLKLAFKGDIRYLWVPCRKSDNRYAALLAAFGPDENNWVDGRINLYLEKDEFSEGYRQAVSTPQPVAKKGGK